MKKIDVRFSVSDMAEIQKMIGKKRLCFHKHGSSNGLLW